jgi:hypothetical protein
MFTTNSLKKPLGYEPAWYDNYKQKAAFLMPRWNGRPGELETYTAFVLTLARRTAVLYFLVSEFAAIYGEELKRAPLPSPVSITRALLSFRSASSDGSVLVSTFTTEIDLLLFLTRGGVASRL